MGKFHTQIVKVENFNTRKMLLESPALYILQAQCSAYHFNKNCFSIVLHMLMLCFIAIAM
jgi:hypothetical protein